MTGMQDKIAWWQELSAEFGKPLPRPDELECFFQRLPGLTTKDEMRLLFEQLDTPMCRAIAEVVDKHTKGCTDISDLDDDEMAALERDALAAAHSRNQ